MSDADFKKLCDMLDGFTPAFRLKELEARLKIPDKPMTVRELAAVVGEKQTALAIGFIADLDALYRLKGVLRRRAVIKLGFGPATPLDPGSVEAILDRLSFTWRGLSEESKRENLEISTMQRSMRGLQEAREVAESDPYTEGAANGYTKRIEELREHLIAFSKIHENVCLAERAVGDAYVLLSSFLAVHRAAVHLAAGEDRPSIALLLDHGGYSAPWGSFDVKL